MGKHKNTSSSSEIFFMLCLSVASKKAALLSMFSFMTSFYSIIPNWKVLTVHFMCVRVLIMIHKYMNHPFRSGTLTRTGSGCAQPHGRLTVARCGR